MKTINGKIIRCEFCNTVLSERDINCPNCGAPNEEFNRMAKDWQFEQRRRDIIRNKAIETIIAVFVLIVILSMFLFPIINALSK